MLNAELNKNYHFLTNTQTELSLNSLFEVSFWQKEQRIMGSSSGRGVTYFIQAADLDIGKNLVLRHYYRGGLYRHFSKDHFLFTGLNKSRSFAEFNLLNHLNSLDFKVPQPIAARVIKHGLFYSADILIEYINDSQDLTQILQQTELSADIWFKIGKLIRQLHNLSINHSDLNAHNILLQYYDIENTDSIEYWLIDFDKCYIASGESWKQANLDRLHRSFLKEVSRLQIKFNPDNWQQLLAGYRE